MLIALGAIVVFLLWLGSRTRWEPAEPFPVRRRRPWGVIVASSGHLYAHHLRLVLGLGALFVPLGVVITAVQFLVFRFSRLGALVDSAGASNALVAGLAILMGALFTAGFAFVPAATSIAIAAFDDDKELGALAASRLALRRWRALLGTFLLGVVVLGVLELTAIGSIVAIWLLVRWSLWAQVVALEDTSARAALKRSGKLVRGNWWRVASLTLFVTAIGLLLGPLTGAILLFITSASFNFVNLISSLIYAIALPFAAIATAYLYFDLALHEEQREAKAVTAVPSLSRVSG